MLDRNITQMKTLKDIAREPFAFPGGYLKALLLDGSVICGPCAEKTFKTIARDIIGGYYMEAGVFLVYDGEEDGSYCDECNKPLAEI